jgi:hypothetical protein
MSEKKETQTQTAQSFADRVHQAKEAGKRASQKKRNEEAHAQRRMRFSDHERTVGTRMLPLLTQDCYRALDEFENFNIADAMAKAFDPPNPAWLNHDKATFGELMAFKKGFNIGLQVLRIARQNLMSQLLEDQAEEAKVNAKDNE